MAGKVVWTREFERLAGVQFVDLTETNQEEIRQWLAPPTLVSDAAEAKESLAELETCESSPEPTEELEPPSMEGLVKAPELARPSEAVLTQWVPKAHTGSHPLVARLTFLVVSGCLVAFAITAGVRLLLSRAEQHEVSVETAPAQPEETAEPVGASNASLPASSLASSPSSPDVPVSSISSTSVVASSLGAAPTFQVEVQDSNGRRWTLRFVRDGSKSENGPGASHTAKSSIFPALKAKATKHKEAPAEKSQVPRRFILAGPTLNPIKEGSSEVRDPSAEAPAIQRDLAALSRGVTEGIPTNRPVAPLAEKPVGGLVRIARLIRSAPPVYPAFAKTTRVSGDVMVDALIDAAGNVTSVRVIAGPLSLQQAAIEAVRQWKYEPARLDGQAVAMHLNVTVSFHLN